MKVLVYGSGVIGCYLAHVLCAAGNDVTLLARGQWKEQLQRNGLRIRHHLQRKTTLDHPRPTDSGNGSGCSGKDGCHESIKQAMVLPGASQAPCHGAWKSAGKYHLG